MTKQQISHLKQRMKIKEYKTKEVFSEWESDVSDELFAEDTQLNLDLNSTESSGESEEEKKGKKGWSQIKNAINNNVAKKFVGKRQNQTLAHTI